MTQPKNLAFLDVETTGFAYKSRDRIVEIGIVKTDLEGNVIDELETLVNPVRDVGPTHIHGITAEMVAEAPPFEALTDTILDFLDDTVWVAHNAVFDVNFLLYELQRTGETVTDIPYLCTLQKTRQLFPELPSKKLEVVCDYFDIELAQAHAALADAKATTDLFFILLEADPRLPYSVTQPFHPTRSCTGNRGTLFNRSRFERRSRERVSPLARLLGHLPTIETQNEGESAYAELLDEVLMDRIVTDAEYDSLLSLAREYGITKEGAERIHLDYLHNLIRYALLDGVISQTEQSDIRKVWKLLGLDHLDLNAMIEQIRTDVNDTYSQEPASHSQDLRGKSVCFTGALTCCLHGEPITRKRAQELAAENGMVIKKGVSKSLDYLVAADPHSQSGKAKKARQYEIPVVAEAAFWRMLGVLVE